MLRTGPGDYRASVTETALQKYKTYNNTCVHCVAPQTLYVNTRTVLLDLQLRATQLTQFKVSSRYSDLLVVTGLSPAFRVPYWDING